MQLINMMSNGTFFFSLHRVILLWIPVEVHRLRRVVLVGPLPVPVETLGQSVGSQQVGAGEARHLWSSLGLHASVEILKLSGDNILKGVTTLCVT